MDTVQVLLDVVQQRWSLGSGRGFELEKGLETEHTAHLESLQALQQLDTMSEDTGPDSGVRVEGRVEKMRS